MGFAGFGPLRPLRLLSKHREGGMKKGQAQATSRTPNPTLTGHFSWAMVIFRARWSQVVTGNDQSPPPFREWSRQTPAPLLAGKRSPGNGHGKWSTPLFAKWSTPPPFSGKSSRQIDGRWSTIREMVTEMVNTPPPPFPRKWSREMVM